MSSVTVRPLAGSSLESKLEVPERLARCEGQLPPAHHGMFRVLTPEAGDERYVWDRRDFAAIREAKDFFNKMVAQGMVPYRVGRSGAKSPEVMAEFDPLAEEVIFAPIRRAVGG